MVHGSWFTINAVSLNSSMHNGWFRDGITGYSDIWRPKTINNKILKIFY
jgi:hypothetical protein